MDDNEKEVIEKAIGDLQQRIDERIDNLCAIYGTDKLRYMIGSLITLDSALSAHTKLIFFVAETEREAKAATEVLCALQPSVFSRLAANMMDMLEIPDARRDQLIQDVIGIVRVRKQCEEQIEQALKRKL